jgi:GTP cyclohydrolase II
VYNRRKRGGDSAAEYFNNTSAVAGVQDARHQALMPDVLHWLGITHISNLVSMSNLKYDSIIKSGITVQNRYEIPEELIPADGRVEIDAKVSVRAWGRAVGRAQRELLPLWAGCGASGRAGTSYEERSC